MKKLFLIVLMSFLIGGCTHPIEREDYYIFSFGDFTIAPGYDDVEYMRLIFDVELPETIEAHQKLKDREVFFWDEYLADIDIENNTKKPISSNQAGVSRLVFYLSNYPDVSYRLSGVELKDSVRENCELYKGEYIERNGYACAFGKKIGKKKNVVVLYGDLFAIDQDKLDHIEIYVE